MHASYRCVATWHDGGMLEIVKNSATAGIQTRYGGKYGGAFKSDVFEMWLRDNNSTKRSKSSKKGKGKGKERERIRIQNLRRRVAALCYLVQDTACDACHGHWRSA